RDLAVPGGRRRGRPGQRRHRAPSPGHRAAPARARPRLWARGDPARRPRRLPARRPPTCSARGTLRRARTGELMTDRTPSTQNRRRLTRQQAAVAALLESTEDFSSAQEVHARLRQAGDTVGLATVYRTLTGMAEAGEVDMLRSDEGEAVYRMCSTGH